MLSTSRLGSTRAVNVRFQTATVSQCSRVQSASFSTNPRPEKIQRTTPSINRPVLSKKASVRFPINQLRAASTSTNTTSPNSATTSSTTSPESPTLTWNRFLALRRQRRKISVAASSVSAIGTAYVGLRIFIENNYDSIGAATLGLDPIIMTGLGFFSFLGVGWLIGPAFGNTAFNVLHRGIRGEIESKERQFYARIKAHRVDPTSSSMANPVPDYYGEKIGSVAGYRRWLKDQRAFNLKRGAYSGSK